MQDNKKLVDKADFYNRNKNHSNKLIKKLWITYSLDQRASQDQCGPFAFWSTPSGMLE